MKIDRPVEVGAPRQGPRISYAQNMEDILLARLFDGRPGTFVDIGANHPFIENNTYYFYVRGWRGVNIEPIPAGAELFRAHRPADRTLAVAVSDAEGELPFYEVANAEGLNGMSTLSAEVAEGHRRTGCTVREYRVPVRTVAQLIDEHAIEPPDFLTLDVECHEAAVLRGLPLERWRPKVLVIEATLPQTRIASHHHWEPRLIEHGYLFATFNGINNFYLRDDLKDQLECFRVPVNILDVYEKHETTVLYYRVEELSHQLAQAEAARDFDRKQFELIRAGWEWGQRQAEEARFAWAEDRSAFFEQRVAWGRAQETWERDRARWQAERQEQARRLAAQEQALAEVERARFALEKVLAEVERDRCDAEGRVRDLEAQALIREARGAAFEREREHERAAWQREREDHHQQLVATQRQLRPYRLLDRPNLIGRGYSWARRLKHRLAS